MGLYDGASSDPHLGDMGHEHTNVDAPGPTENERKSGEAGPGDDTIPGDSPIPWDRSDDYPKLALASLDIYAGEEQDVPSPVSKQHHFATPSGPPVKMEKSGDVSGKPSSCVPAPTRSGEPSTSARPPVKVSCLERFNVISHFIPIIKMCIYIYNHYPLTIPTYALPILYILFKLGGINTCNFPLCYRHMGLEHLFGYRPTCSETL